MTANIIIRHLGKQQYADVWKRMQDFTRQRDTDTTDEIWVTEHPPVYTLGLNGKREHVLEAGDIPILQVDRGGQVTYHGPGQLIVYTLLDLTRLGIGVRGLVTPIEQAVVATLARYGIRATGRADAPGVYINGSKIAALGLRIRRGCSYHGLSLNIDMDLSPFQDINPCGYKGMKVCQLSDFTDKINLPDISEQLVSQLVSNLGYTMPKFNHGT
ncbi:MAG TPA: lipoyl(octanoyl) transferase LipB, partial [Gammaproteobacteria bacterium]|nr:lipoyl(octanoyl) transferase LipB [Gammaproteobacteria bacterium]